MSHNLHVNYILVVIQLIIVKEKYVLRCMLRIDMKYEKVTNRIISHGIAQIFNQRCHIFDNLRKKSLFPASQHTVPPILSITYFQNNRSKLQYW